MARRLAGVILGLAGGLLAVAGVWAGQAPQAGCRRFAETGQQVCGRFLQYWQEHGGLAQQGFPISGEFAEVSEADGKPYTVQYFERAVFERHLENAAPYDVLLTRLGAQELARRYPGGVTGDPLAALRARPLQIPVVAPGGACPRTPGQVVTPDFSAALGPGPVYPAGLGTSGIAYYGGGLVEGGWAYVKVLWVLRPEVRTPVLVRGRRLDGPQPLRFERGADPPPELVLRPKPDQLAAGHWTDQPSYTRVSAPGCYAYQVDGAGFSTVIFFAAVDAPAP